MVNASTRSIGFTQSAWSVRNVLHIDLVGLKAGADVIITKRRSPGAADVAEKVYTRDLFGVD